MRDKQQPLADELAGPPAWLHAGARVHIVPCTYRAPRRLEIVSQVAWPYCVYLEGSPGAVHPRRCLPVGGAP
jgi:hypothetical protein